MSALHGLGVISRTSAKQYKDSAKTTRQIGEELGVDYILEGTVRWDRSAEGKGRVRVTPQLVRVSDDTHLWSDSYNRALEEALREHPEDSRIHTSLGLVYAYLGRKEEAIREGKRAVSLYPQSKDAYGAPHYVNSLAMIYTVAGEYEEAINQLEYLMSIASGDIVSISVLRLDPMWDPLRQHPRFKRLLEEN